MGTAAYGGEGPILKAMGALLPIPPSSLHPNPLLGTYIHTNTHVTG